MPKSKRKRNPKTVLRLPDLEQSRSAVLNSLASPSSQRAYDHTIRDFIDWYCSEPRLAFNKTVVTRYRINLEAGAIRCIDHQPSTRRCSQTGVRSRRCRAAESGSSCWDPPSERSEEARRTSW